MFLPPRKKLSISYSDVHDTDWLVSGGLMFAGHAKNVTGELLLYGVECGTPQLHEFACVRIIGFTGVVLRSFRHLKRKGVAYRARLLV